MVYKLSREEISAVVSINTSGVSEQQRDEMAIPSYTHSNPLIRWLMWRRYECIAQIGDFSPNCSVLEFGCGIGVFLPTLSKLAGTVYATDLVTEYARCLCDGLSVDVNFIDSVEQLEDHSLDVIVAADVMEHLDDPGAFARLFRSKLKPTGRLIISGPTENIIYKIGRIVAGFGDKGDYHHWNVDNLRVAICDSGFALNKSLGLPFAVPPLLFKVMRFDPV